MPASVDKKILLQSAIFTLLLTLGCGTSSVQGLKRKNSHALPTLENVLDSLHKLMVFFSERYNKVNVDGLFGIRSVEGEMLRALSLGKSGVYSVVRDNDEIRNKIEDIREIATKAAKLALPEVRKQDEKYYKDFLPIIGKPWRTFEVKPQKIIKMKETELPSTHIRRADQEAEISAKDRSNECMMAVIGKKEGKKCDVNSCWDLMTRRATKLYYTTHQVLWLLHGISAGCQQKFEEKIPGRGGGGIERLLRGLCGNIIFQMHTLFKDGSVPNAYQDIFMEQGAICGVIGFMDAVNITWLEGVMKWQDDKLGCFREIDKKAQINTNEYLKWVSDEKKEWRSRNLLTDMEMGDHCSAHKSAVAAGFLAVHLRLFLDPEYKKNQLWPALYGKEYVSDDYSFELKYLALAVIIACLLLILIGPRRRNTLLRRVGFCRK